MINIKPGDTVVCLRDFTKERNTFRSWGFTYPNVGDKLLVIGIADHPQNRFGAMVRFKEHENPISWRHIGGYNFEKIEENISAKGEENE